MMKYYLFLLSILLIPVCALAQESGFVHGSTIKLMSEADFNSAVITTIERGSQVTILEKQKRWLKISYQGDQGWVSKLLIKDTPPTSTNSLLENDETDLKQNSRRRASAVSTTAAARGLQQDADDGNEMNTSADFQAVSEMESNTVSSQEALEFIEQETN